MLWLLQEILLLTLGLTLTWVKKEQKINSDATFLIFSIARNIFIAGVKLLKASYEFLFHFFFLFSFRDRYKNFLIIKIFASSFFASVAAGVRRKADWIQMQITCDSQLMWAKDKKEVLIRFIRNIKNQQTLVCAYWIHWR